MFGAAKGIIGKESTLNTGIGKGRIFRTEILKRPAKYLGKKSLTYRNKA